MLCTGLRHCNYQLSFCVNGVGSLDFRHIVYPALTGAPPPAYSFQSANYGNNYISPIASGAKAGMLMFLPGALGYGPLVPADATWVAAPIVPGAPANFSLQTQATGAYAGQLMAHGTGNSALCAYTAPAGDGLVVPGPPTAASTVYITPVPLAATTALGTPF